MDTNKKRVTEKIKIISNTCLFKAAHASRASGCFGLDGAV